MEKLKKKEINLIEGLREEETEILLRRKKPFKDGLAEDEFEPEA